ncbi:MAG: nitrilase-related carbon-nitrogen hydrolase [Steroidobacteraceae bacterium]
MDPYNVTVVQAAVRPVVRADGLYRREVLEGNVAHLCELVRQGAAAFRSKLFVLPEFCVHGFELGVPTPAWVEASIRLPGPEIEPLCRTARELGVYVAGMAYEKMDEFPGRFFNTAFIIDPRGEIALRYRKLYSLTGKTTPQDVYTEYCRRFGGPASLFPVLDTPLGRLGALVCYDIHFPEVARCLALQGAEVLLHITSEARGPEHFDEGGGAWSAVRKARAWENVCYLAMANSGPNLDSGLPPNVCHGESQVMDFQGRILNRAGGTEECLITASIDIEALRRRRAGQRFAFLTELAPGAHAPIYAAAMGAPLDAFATRPAASVQENAAVQLATYEAMANASRLVRPG